MEQNKTREYTLKQRILTLFAIAIGIAFAWGVCGEYMWSGESDMSSAMLIYGGFWLVYMAGFYFAAWDRAKRNVWGYVLLAVAAVLVLRPLVYKQVELTFINFAALPAVLMLHAVTVCFTVPKERQDGLITAYFKGWFVAPFVCIGRFFGAIGSAFGRGKASKNGTAVRVGLIMGIPLAALCAALLINADAAMQLSIGRFFEGLRIGAVIWRAIAALAAAVLFFSFIYYMAYEQKALPETPYQRIIPAAAAKIAVGMLLTLYVAYAVFQFAYLTGLRGLPEGLTYSQYAVQGFGELCAVSIINIGVYALFSTAAEEDTALRRFLAGLMLSAFVLLMCAAFRLYMYIDAYGLTLRRILSAWFMVCILAAVIICIVRLYDKRLRALQAMAITAAVLYAALNLINIDAMIAQSVLKKADARGYMTELDARYLAHELSSDADGVIAKSEHWREQVYKMGE